MQIFAALTRVALLAGLIVFAAGQSRAVTTLDVYENNVLVGSFNDASLNCTPTVGGTHCEIGHTVLGSLEFGEASNPTAPGVSIELIDDPEIVTSFGVKNLAGATSLIKLVFTTTAVIPVGTLTGGSTSVSFGDNDGDGVTIASGPMGAIYSSTIDNAVWQQLLIGASDTQPIGGTLGPDSFGNPIPSLAGPAVAANIGITYEFTLTGGSDAADATGRFVVKPVPEPVTAALVALGLVALAAAGRQRRR